MNGLFRSSNIIRQQDLMCNMLDFSQCPVSKPQINRYDQIDILWLLWEFAKDWWQVVSEFFTYYTDGCYDCLYTYVSVVVYKFVAPLAPKRLEIFESWFLERDPLFYLCLSMRIWQLIQKIHSHGPFFLLRNDSELCFCEWYVRSLWLTS